MVNAGRHYSYTNQAQEDIMPTTHTERLALAQSIVPDFASLSPATVRTAYRRNAGLI